MKFKKLVKLREGVLCTNVSHTPKSEGILDQNPVIVSNSRRSKERLYAELWPFDPEPRAVQDLRSVRQEKSNLDDKGTIFL